MDEKGEVVYLGEGYGASETHQRSAAAIHKCHPGLREGQGETTLVTL